MDSPTSVARNLAATPKLPSSAQHVFSSTALAVQPRSSFLLKPTWCGPLQEWSMPLSSLLPLLMALIHFGRSPIAPFAPKLFFAVMLSNYSLRLVCLMR